MTDDTLFRSQAASSFLRPDAPGTLVSVTPPWAVAVFGVMAAVFVALAALAAFGHAQVVVEGRGVVRLDQPPMVVYAGRSGKIESVKLKARDAGKAGEMLLTMDDDGEGREAGACLAQNEVEERDLAALEKRIADWNADTSAAHEREASTALVLLSQLRTQRDKVGALHQRCGALMKTVAKGLVTLPADATVMEIAVSPGSQVKEGDKLALLAPRSASLVGYLTLPETQRGEIAVGQKVRLRFDALPAHEAGAGTGHVARLLDTLPTGVKTDASDAAPLGVFVEVGIDAMPAGAGPPRSGMTFGGDVLTRRARIASLLFGGDDAQP